MEYFSIKNQAIREQVFSGMIKINTKEDFELPKTQSLPLDSNEKGIFREIKIWLVDIQDEVFLEDYYFYLDWLPNKPIIKIPKGFKFNGASVPKYLRNFFSPKGILYTGSIFHDFSYQYWGLITIDNEVINYNCEREFCDQLFRDFNRKVFKLKVISYVAWLAVRVAGIRGWKSYRREAANINDYL